MDGKSVVLVLNGPNLDQLHRRDSSVYGKTSLQQIEGLCHTTAESLGWLCSCKQSNHEGQLVEWLHQAFDEASAVVINAGAYTHTSIAIRDALEMLVCPKVEVHLSNIHAREPFRHRSLIADVVNGSVVGLGPMGYEIAVRAAVQLASPRS